MKLADDLQSYALRELETLVKIPSVSFPGFDRRHVHESAEATGDCLKRAGFQNVELAQIDGCFPYVVGEFTVNPEFPTYLLYAHHDVQPAGREELWKSPPFVPTLRDGRLYGRGTADDKAGILVHATALKAILADPSYVNSLKANLKIIIEGEEEVGSDHLLDFLKQNRERLSADAIIVTDTGNIQQGVPSLTTSLRGLVVVEVEVKSLKAPLHSGIWGGGVVDPVQVLIKMISGLTDMTGKILLKSIGKSNRAQKYRVPISKKEFAEQAGVLKTNSVPNDFFTQIWDMPSLSINAIQASSEKLANNIVCDRAYARLGIRLTAREKGAKVQAELIKKLKGLAPSSVEVSIRGQEPADAWSTNPFDKKNRWAFEVAEKALEKGFGVKPVHIGCGATIPFIAPFEKALNAPVISIGIEDPLTLAHSENESLLVDDFFKAIASEIEIFKSVTAKR
jgi:acetylornithine deacetylase/succinyl-diaminopimelate desuccinylase-like protein